MKLSRSRTSRRRCNSNSNININNSSRRSKRKKVLTIDLDVAKSIVEQACIVAMNADSVGLDDKDDETIDAHCNNHVEFAEFVSSAIARAIVSSVAKANSTDKVPPQPLSLEARTTQTPTNKRGRPRKRPRKLESRVEGLEHTESLHAMCSLFPVLHDSGVVVPMAMPMVISTTTDANHHPSSENEAAGDHQYILCAERESLVAAADLSSEESSNSKHSDHDSLLPPLGASSATTTPTRPTTTTTYVASVSNKSASQTPPPKQLQQQHPTTITQESSPPPAITTSYTTTENASASSFLLALALTRMPTDCDYDCPLIGVVGDEGSTVSGSHLSSKTNGRFNKLYGHNNTNNNNTNDAIIRLTKIGSIPHRGRR